MIRYLFLPFSLILNLIPGRSLYRIGGFLGSAWFYILRFRRGIMLSNLRLAYGNSISAEQVLNIAHANYQHYGRLLLETLKSVCWEKKDYIDNVCLQGWENLEPFLRTGTGGFLLASHLGNWEIAAAAVAAKGAPLDLVVKHARNKKIEAFLQWYRRKTGCNVFLESGTARDILKSVSSGRFVIFVMDQFMGPPIGLPVSFFGHPAGTVVSLALLSEKRQVPIIPVYSYRDQEGKLHGVIESPLCLPQFSDEKNERLFQKTQLFNDIIEKIVRRYPDQWLWLHRRWKEYRGIPRWLPKTAVTVATLALITVTACGCASTGDTPTGIPLPPDPAIRLPQFQPTPTGEADVDNPTIPTEVKVVPEGAAPTGPPTPTPSPTPSATPAPSPAIKRKQAHKQSKRKHDVKSIMESENNHAVTDYFTVFPSDRVPFEIGERLQVDLTWMAIPAGRIVLEVRDGIPFEGRPTFHLWGNLLSSKVADAIYHVDNTIEAYIDKEALIPYKFLLHMVESAQKKETRVSFDHSQNKAFYWAQRISKKWGDDKQDRADTFRPHSRDMFSAVYFARTLNYKLHEKQIFPIYENNQNLDVEMLPVANELVTTKAGAFQCWKILVTVRINNVLKPTGDVYLWLSDDSKKYIVKFDAKLKIGSLYGILSSIRER